MNAKQELIRAIAENKVKCVSIVFGDSCQDEDNTHIILKVEHSEEDYNNFLSKLDFDYDNGYGGQNLFGTIWLTNNTWLSRGEYDGSEWWNHHVIPEIAKELL